jgi:hypothetical protein
MPIKHRIERLENKHLPSIRRVYVIVSKYGESRAEAEQRYCEEKGILIEDLEAPGVMIRMVRFRRPGDVTSTGVSTEESTGKAWLLHEGGY